MAAPGQPTVREQVVFKRKTPHESFAAALYTRTAEQAREPVLFEACGIPDTLDGRFDALALHAALMIDRLRLEPDGEALAQAFFDAMFRHLDLTLREIGVQDLGVGRRIKIMAEGLHGRALAYRDALAGGSAPFSDVLRRNAYGGRSPDDVEVGRLEAHIRDYAARLARTSRPELTK
jgi:cytochrome b pre-mRNA-processing protein 3